MNTTLLDINKIYNGDCLIESDKIESGSVDLILTDLPYGTMGMKNTNHGMTNKVGWDCAIEPSKVFGIADRILRKNGKMILFSQEPYTTELIVKSIPNIPYCYKAIWIKDHFANALNAKKAMLNYYEDILIFSKNNSKLDFKKSNPLRKIMNKYVVKYGEAFIIELFKSEGRYTSEISAKVHASYKFGYNKGDRIDLMTESLYNYLKGYIEFKESYDELKNMYHNYHDNLKQELNEMYPSTFNLWDGNKYKGNILTYKKDYEGLHPTQKPILLLEDLIKTFSNKNDLVVDLTIGSGSTAVACINAGRNYIGFEMDYTYYNVACDRIDKHIKY